MNNHGARNHRRPTLRNLTGFPVRLRRRGCPDLVLEPEPEPARCGLRLARTHSLGNLDVAEFAPVLHGLPDPATGVLYIVSRDVAQTASEAGRGDVLSIDTTAESAHYTSSGRLASVARLRAWPGTVAAPAARATEQDG